MEGGVQRKSSEVRQHTGWKGNGSCLSFLDRLCLWVVGLRKRWLRAKEPQEMDVEMWGTQADLRQESNFRHWDFHSGFQIHLHKGFLGSYIFSLHCGVWFRRSREGSDLSAFGCTGTLKACLGWKATVWNEMFSLLPSLFSLLFFLWLSICYWQIHGSNLLKELWKLMNKQKK